MGRHENALHHHPRPIGNCICGNVGKLIKGLCFDCRRRETIYKYRRNLKLKLLTNQFK